jgi:hypothetical protein
MHGGKGKIFFDEWKWVLIVITVRLLDCIHVASKGQGRGNFEAGAG